MLIQNYLRTQGNLDSLAVKAKRHESLVLLKYDQLEADFTNPMVRECRGLILDEANDFKVICRSFDKFANWGESYADTIDWSTAKVQEKLDGSLCNMYFFRGSWRVATSGSPDASGDVHGNDLTFKDHFWDNLKVDGGDAFSENLTYSFELTGPLNRIVVRYPKPSLTLIGVRCRETGIQLPVEPFAHIIGVPAVRSFPITSLEEALRVADTLNPLEQEGFVVVDAAFRRIKIKSPQYVRIHHAKDGMTPRRMLDIARNGETSEVEAVFPELSKEVNEAREKYQRMLARCESEYANLKDIDIQKEFAYQAVLSPFSAALFKRRQGVSFSEFFKTLHIDKVMELANV